MNKKHIQTLVKSDTPFRAHARLLQHRWREEKGYSVGRSINNTLIGNYIDDDFAKTEKVNLLTENIREQVDKAIKNKDEKALIDENRLWTNMLSSQPLCFNLFGELASDLDLATLFFKKLFPNKIEAITNILFEYSKWRDNPLFTGDRSAFDVFVEYKNKGKNGFLGIEVKYAESLREESPTTAKLIFQKNKNEYLQWTTDDIFKLQSIDTINKPPLSQIWRDHLPAISVLKNKIYDEGYFIFLYPKDNSQCENGVTKYKTLLVSDDIDQTLFYPMYLDDYINTLHGIVNADWSKELKERYLGNA